ncbi:MAG: hypothetical protein LBD54_00340, partial [Puniceicoccales bacterium]|nr:hypothetical protein [Puniceicoccales bacterium]
RRIKVLQTSALPLGYRAEGCLETKRRSPESQVVSGWDENLSFLRRDRKPIVSGRDENLFQGGWNENLL